MAAKKREVGLARPTSIQIPSVTIIHGDTPEARAHARTQSGKRDRHKVILCARERERESENGSG